MNISSRKRIALAVVAVTAAGIALGPASAALAAQSNGSQQAAWLVDTDTEVKLDSGPDHLIGFKQPATLVSDLQTPAKDFTEDPTATAAQVFLSKPGDELNKSQYIGVAGAAFGIRGREDNFGTRFIYVTLDDLADGPAAGDVKDIKVTPGTYSLGFVYTNNNGVQIAAGKGSWVTIHVTNSGQGDYYYDEPQESGVAPAVTTQPVSQSVTVGANATFTAAASGTPAPSVQWQSKAGSADWADVSGATSAGYTVSGATGAQNGTQYRAVFTNASGSVSSDAATLTVVTAPAEPKSGDAGNVFIPAPAVGDTTVTIPAGSANANKTFRVFAWSTATDLGTATTDASGNATVDVSSLSKDEQHTIALAESNLTVAAWGTFTVPGGAGDPVKKDVNLNVGVSASNKWELVGVPASIDFGDVKRGQTSTKQLGDVKVTDDRNVLKGWTLTAAVTDFASTDGTIDKAALAIAPKKIGGDVSGVTLGTGATIAEAAVGTATGMDGTAFNADLTFTAPRDAKVGTYNSTLTLTLASK